MWSVDASLADDFFVASAAMVQPSQIDAWAQKLKTFLDKTLGTDANVVLVTSGGTTVPLERKTVRYIDNFSTGGRG